MVPVGKGFIIVSLLFEKVGAVPVCSVFGKSLKWLQRFLFPVPVRLLGYAAMLMT